VPSYLKKPWHTLSTHHGIYHIYLKDLNKIMVLNRTLIERYIQDFDGLVLDIERFNNARRKIAHTKYLNALDIERLDNLYSKSKKLINQLSRSMSILP
jgi:hypothetical protein